MKISSISRPKILKQKSIVFSFALVFILGLPMVFPQLALAADPTACDSVTLSETSKFVGAPEANWSVAVTAPTVDCTWTTSSDSAWLTVTSTTPTPAAGSGSVQLRSTDNGGAAREGHFTIGGVVYTVDQEAGPFCPTGRSALIVSGARGSGASFTTSTDGKQTTATFQLSPGCTGQTVSLMSWQKQSTTDKYPQTLIKTVNGVFSGDGTDHTLTIDLPPCQMQVDLVIGTSFTDTTLDATNDAVLGLQVADWVKNDTACTDTPPPPPPPTFPSCMGLTSAPGDLAHFTDGMHQIAGGPLLAGKDDVYSLSDANAVQCFCPPTGVGIQTNWWKTDSNADGAIVIDNGLSWGLADGRYLAFNSDFNCNPPVLPNCQKLLSGGPGDLAHFTDGLHQIAGGDLLTGADDVYSFTGGNAMQCFCPPTGPGIQTQWWKTDLSLAGWINIANGLSWGLSDSAYLALNSSFDCTTPTSGGGGGDTQPTLTVTKVVVNNFDGKSVVADFPLKVNDTSVTSGVSATFAPGDYVVTESGPAGYNGVFTGDCDSTGHITLALNHSYTCTLTNTDIAPTGGSGGGSVQPILTVTKVVVNNFDGTSVVTDFVLKANDTVVTSGTAATLAPGDYTITESGPAGYNGVFTGDCDSTGHITLALDHTYACTLTNTDIAPVGGSVGGGGGGGTSFFVNNGSGGGGGSILPTGTTVAVTPPATPDVGGTGETPGEVLGASTELPRTGAPVWLDLLILLAVVGAVNHKFLLKHN